MKTTQTISQYTGTLKMIEVWGYKGLADGALERTIRVLAEAGDTDRLTRAQREMTRRNKGR